MSIFEIILHAYMLFGSVGHNVVCDLKPAT